ncbi:uncharacterized protein LOC135946905 isoform X1 [Cloeon dipterum]|uniref:uncharacterized protein LOC135946905 isoform X1 n=1 Tax=Cloeon dipterum TaxID=197152 RepID=UPI00321FABF4
MGVIEVVKRYGKVFLFLIVILVVWNYGNLVEWKEQSGKLFSIASNSEIEDVWDLYKYSQREIAIITEMYQDDEELVQIVRERFLLPPVTMEYNLTRPELDDQSMGQGNKIRQILGEMTHGFFVECGALDGETRSNSLYFERFLEWEGLLVEADPLNFEQVIQKRRKAWLAPTCLSLERRPQLVNFMQAKNVGKILGKNVEFNGKSTEVLCIPITTLLLALNKKRIDYFSLDVEGNELEVLRTIDFDQFDIRTLSVEFKHVKAGKDMVQRFMNEKGYEVHSTVTRSDNLANDFIFMKKD